MQRPWRAALLALTLTALSTTVRADDFRVVVHSSVAGNTISRAVLASIYMKETVSWGNGSHIVPIHQSSQSPVRQAFARQILEQSLGEQQLFWRRRMAAQTRVLPPRTKASDEEVLAFVTSHEGAIGYLSASFEIPPDVKVVTLFD